MNLDTLADLIEEIVNGTCVFCEYSTTDLDDDEGMKKMLGHLHEDHGTFTINRT